MFLKDEKHGKHHKSYDDIAKAAANGCKVCHSIRNIKNQLEPSSQIYYTFEWHNGWRGHWSIGFSDDETAYANVHAYVHVSRADSTPAGYDQFLRSVNDDLETDSSHVRRTIPALRDIPDNTGDEMVAKVAKEWLETCKEKHTCDKEHATQEPGWYPDRLIHVGNSEEEPRLVLRSDRPDGPYAALSHCWGDDPQFLMLTSTNVEEFRQEIPLEEVAASFRDAIITCRRLGIPYIWIDSLCILQSGEGSQEDWLLHSSEMHKVYQNCELNIAIHVAANAEEGAFRWRDPDFLQDCYVWTPFHEPSADSVWSLDEDRNIVKSQSFRLKDKDLESEDEDPIGGAPTPETQDQNPLPSKTHLCAVFSEDDFSYSRRHLPLSRRAWVLQEKLLSPRTLHFQTDRIAWECHAKPFQTEYLPDSIASNQWHGFDCLFQTRYNIQEHGLTHQTFFDYVAEYMDANLSHPNEDKFVAFAAITRRFGEKWDHDYCAGVFRPWFPQALLWDTMLYTNTTRATVYRAPSWSWANIDGRINLSVISDGEGTDFATVTDVQVQLVDPLNPYGQVKSASLVLTGPMIDWKSLVHRTAMDEGSDDDGEKKSPYGTDQLREMDEALNITTFPGDHVELRPDHFPLLTPIDRNLIKTCIGSTDDVWFVAVTEMVNPPRLECWSGCYGLILRRLEDGTYVRLGLWKAKLGFLGKHSEGGCMFQEKSVKIV